MAEPSSEIIRVVPDKNAPFPHPQVIVSKWDVTLPGGGLLDFQLIDTAPEWNFDQFLTNSAALSFTISGDKKNISVVFDPSLDPITPPEYKYTIVLRRGASPETIDTQPQSGGPDPNRPVIRN